MEPVTNQPQTPIDPLVRCAVETERFVAAAGWDQNPRLFALVATQRLLQAEPHLAGQLSAESDDSISAIEQDGLPEADNLTDLLAQLGWPAEVDGVALAVERVVLPSDAAADLPDDPQLLAEAAASHPRRVDVRLLVAVLRDGSSTCALRQRAHDSDHDVAIGADIAPDLVRALSATLLED